MKKFLASVLAILAAFALVFAYNLIINNTVAVTSYEIYSPKLGSEFDGYRILAIADFHNSSNYELVARRAKEANPDIIVLVGDMINMLEPDFENTRALIELLSGSAPIYSVEGNHERFSSYRSRFLSFLDESGVKLTDSLGIEIKRGNSVILLYGMPDFNVNDDQIAASQDLKGFLSFCDKWVREEYLNILLMHRANVYPYIKNEPFDLIISGHLHGGLIRLPFVGGLISPATELFPKYTCGIYSEGRSKMVVSRGIDKSYKRMRFFNRPELVLITLKK